ncbi:Cystathionine beta-lyase PatB [compost metagenome]
MAEICERNNILVISDEVHQDLIFSEDARHIPFAMLNDAAAHNSIVCTAPSKTFNIAGLSCANILIPNDQLRRAYQAQSERNSSFLIQWEPPHARRPIAMASHG